jgi:hypothetical protein
MKTIIFSFVELAVFENQVIHREMIWIWRFWKEATV